MPGIIGHFLSWLGVGLPAFLFVITLVVFIHELGHFLVARLCGVKVEAFSIGFGHEIFGFTDRKGTRWKVSWLPLGGYVKFLGDADVSSRPDRETIREYEARRISGSGELRASPSETRLAASTCRSGRPIRELHPCDFHLCSRVARLRQTRGTTRRGRHQPGFCGRNGRHPTR